MSGLETAPSSATEYEAKPFLSYEEYRQLCEESQPDVLRKTGIPTAEDYEAAKANSRTIYAEVFDRQVPLFTPIECVSGYNRETSQRMTGSEEIYVLSLPFEVINDQEMDISWQLATLDEDAAVIVETSANRTEDIQAEISLMLPDNSVHEFLDPRLKGERQKASISLYAAYMEARDDEGRLIPKRGERTLLEAFDQERETNPNGSVELIEPSQIRNDEELFEQLWNLHDEKFDWLGEYHPVSMQESKDFFKQILSNDHTESFVHFDIDEEGGKVEPVCHGCIMDGLELIEWLTDRYKKQAQEDLDAYNERIQFFYGIVGKSTPGKMAHLSKDVIGLDARLLKQNGGRTIVLFESTNMSSPYIRRMISQYTSDEPNGVKLAGEIQTLAKLDYWYFKPQFESQAQSYSDVEA